MENKKILIIEDDNSILYSLRKKLELIEGLEVLSAEDGELGLEVALREKPDLILLDIILPKMDGIAMLAKLRKDDWGKNVKVIILTNLSNSDKEREAKVLRVEDFIVKADEKIIDVVLKIQDVLKG